MIQVNQFSPTKNQALFSSKDKSKILKCRLLQFLFGALRFNHFIPRHCLQTAPFSFTAGKGVMLRMFKTQPVRSALVLGCGMQLFQQLCGINTVM